MNKKLNNQYFETKKRHKESYKKGKLTFKKLLINLIITLVFILLYNLFSKYLHEKIESNRKNNVVNLGIIIYLDLDESDLLV